MQDRPLKGGFILEDENEKVWANIDNWYMYFFLNKENAEDLAQSLDGNWKVKFVEIK